MRILAVTNSYPIAETPALGTYIEQQIKGLRIIGVDVEILFLNRAQEGMRVYRGIGKTVRQRAAYFEADLIHIMYGGVIADKVTREVDGRPSIVSYCGSDLLGENFSGVVRKIISKYGIRASHRAARRARGIVVKSRNLYDALPKDINRSKVRIIPNGIDLDLFRPIDRSYCRHRLGWHRNEFHVLFPANSGDP